MVVTETPDEIRCLNCNELKRDVDNSHKHRHRGTRAIRCTEGRHKYQQRMPASVDEPVVRQARSSLESWLADRRRRLGRELELVGSPEWIDDPANHV